MSSAVAGARSDMAGSMTRLVDAAGRYAAARLAGPLDDAVTAVKKDVPEPGGVLPGAAVGVAKAAAKKQNPVWAAAKGAWSGTDTKTKVWIVVGLVLALLLGPVVLVIGLLALLIAAVVKAIRDAMG